MIKGNDMEIMKTKKASGNSIITYFRGMKFILFTSTLCLLLSLSLLAQEDVPVSIKGKIINKETGLPMEYVNVFLASTTIGTTTGKDGAFTIKNVPSGIYDIIFSYVGFEMQKMHIQIYEHETLNYNISLVPKPLNYSQIDIVAKTPEDWKDNLKTFKKMFLGVSDNLDETKILNPEVINFKANEKSDLLKAYSDSLLKIENRSLGYMINVVLDSLIYNKSNESIKYVVYSRFQELVPTSKEDSIEWDHNRYNTYKNSPRYFFYQLVHKKLYKNEFKLYTGTIDDLLNREGTPIEGQDLDVTSEKDSSVYKLNFRGCLKVKRGSQTSILSFYIPSTSIDKNGNFLKSFYTVEIYGYWSKQGMADSLPLNYVYTEK
jgi:hypothetical protein